MTESILKEIAEWVLILFFLVLIFFLIFAKTGWLPKIANYALSLERFIPGVPQEKISINEEWSKILKDYYQNQCKINQFTCRAENFPCKCFSFGEFTNKEKPDTCTSENPYCYEKQTGCSSTGPDTTAGIELCSKSNQNFELPPQCEVDINTCKIKNTPCSCHTSYSKSSEALPEICLENQYCYNRQIGCDSKGLELLYLNYCKESLK